MISLVSNFLFVYFLPKNTVFQRWQLNPFTDTLSQKDHVHVNLFQSVSNVRTAIKRASAYCWIVALICKQSKTCIFDTNWQKGIR